MQTVTSLICDAAEWATSRSSESGAVTPLLRGDKQHTTHLYNLVGCLIIWLRFNIRQ